MRKEITYENAPRDIKEALKAATMVADILPPPEMLVPKEETRKITISLSKRSIDFFKTAAEETHVPYQQMIRKVLDSYTDHYAK